MKYNMPVRMYCIVIAIHCAVILTPPNHNSRWARLFLHQLIIIKGTVGQNQYDVVIIVLTVQLREDNHRKSRLLLGIVRIS